MDVQKKLNAKIIQKISHKIIGKKIEKDYFLNVRANKF
jgi:hypothetical protein